MSQTLSPFLPVHEIMISYDMARTSYICWTHMWKHTSQNCDYFYFPDDLCITNILTSLEFVTFCLAGVNLFNTWNYLLLDRKGCYLYEFCHSILPNNFECLYKIHFLRKISAILLIGTNEKKSVWKFHVNRIVSFLGTLCFNIYNILPT